MKTELLRQLGRVHIEIKCILLAFFSVICFSMQANAEALFQQESDGQAEVSVSGKITDENGEGLQGVTILVSGTSTGTTTDAEGAFQLNVPEDASLTISFIGYITQNISVGGRSVINVQLEPDLEILEEVVVVGYGTQEKAKVTGALVSIDSEELNQRLLSQSRALRKS